MSTPGLDSQPKVKWVSLQLLASTWLFSVQSIGPTIARITFLHSSLMPRPHFSLQSVCTYPPPPPPPHTHTTLSLYPQKETSYLGSIC